MVFDMQTQFNPMTNEMEAQTDNPIFSDSSSNIEIVRKPDLSNQTLLENINTSPNDDIELKVNEPDENEIAKFVNEPDYIDTPTKKKDILKQQKRIAQQKYSQKEKEKQQKIKEENEILKSIMNTPIEPEPEPVKKGRKKKDKK